MPNAAANPNVSGASSSCGSGHGRRQLQAVWLCSKYFDRAALDQLLAAAKRRHGKSKLE